MTWNYRIIDRADGYYIYEVYYTNDGRKDAFSLEPMYPYGDTLDELRSDLEYMQAALDKPILLYEDLIVAVFQDTDNRRQELEIALQELVLVAESWQRVGEKERAEGLERRAEKIRDMILK